MTVNAATGVVVYDVDVSFFKASQQGVENPNWMKGNVMFYTSTLGTTCKYCPVRSGPCTEQWMQAQVRPCISFDLASLV
jgi:hypothetical protein